MKILITGVTGFAGSHLANLLSAEPGNLDLYGTYRHSARNTLMEISGKVKLLECDVNYFESVERVVEEVLPDIIFHFAAYVSVAKSFENPAFTFQTNVTGTINLLEAVRKVRQEAKVLIPGSAEAYGRVEPENMPIKETQILKPRNPYGLSKAVQEMLGLYYFDTFGLNTYLPRTFHYTGPGQPAGFVCSDFARQIVEVEKSRRADTINAGNLKAKRDFLDIRDVVRAYWEIVTKGSPGTVYNVCRGSSIAIEEVLHILQQMSSRNINVAIDKTKLRPVDVPDFVGDNSRLKKDTSWTPRLDMHQSLQDVLDFWRVKLNDSA
jgi:GDP-4-dehydro-6-deoxy-D-mannose reductase